MEIYDFFQDEDAASPVIAVVLVVAVVVLLTAVVGPVVIGMGTQATEGKPTPNFKLEWSYDEGSSTLTMTHRGGETVEQSSLKFVGTKSGTLSPTWTGGDDELTVQDDAELSGVQSDETVRVFWIDPDDDDQDKQQLVAMWIGPDDDPPDA